MIGLKASYWQLISASILGFLIGFKILEAVFHYAEFVNNPQEFILSLRGHLLGGIVGAILSVYSKYKSMQSNLYLSQKQFKKKFILIKL